MYWGKLYRQITESGAVCLNPCGLSLIRVSMKQESVDLPNLKTTDCKGSTLNISAIVRYRVIKISFPIKNCFLI